MLVKDVAGVGAAESEPPSLERDPFPRAAEPFVDPTVAAVPPVTCPRTLLESSPRPPGETIPLLLGEDIADELGLAMPEVLGEVIDLLLGDEKLDVFGEPIPLVLGDPMPAALGDAIPPEFSEPTAVRGDPNPVGLGDPVPAELGEAIPAVFGEEMPRALGDAIPDVLGEVIERLLGDGIEVPVPSELCANAQDIASDRRNETSGFLIIGDLISL